MRPKETEVVEVAEETPSRRPTPYPPANTTPDTHTHAGTHLSSFAVVLEMLL